MDKIYEKKLLKIVNWKVLKNKIGQKNAFIIIIQIQNKNKITATQIEKYILTRNEDENIGTHG